MKNFFSRIPWWVWWTLFSVLASFNSLIRDGEGIVSQTYAIAAERLQQGISPYLPPPGRGDQFKYSPFFAFAYQLLLFFSAQIRVILWAFLNAGVFWYGVYRLNTCLLKQTHWWLAAALTACSFELDGSLRYQQVNALLIGLVLVGVSNFIENRKSRAGFWLALATNLKVLPALPLLALSYPFEKKYFKGMILAAAVVVLPLFFYASFQDIWQLHYEWFEVLRRDTQAEGLWDVKTVFSIMGYPAFGEGLRYFILVVTCLCVFGWRLSRPEKFPWNAVLSLMITCLLLVSPRTESPTFVLIGPVYMMLLAAAEQVREKTERYLILFFSIAGIFLVSIIHNDIWPRALYRTDDSTKVWGTLILWSLSLVLAVNSALRLKSLKQVPVAG